MPLAAILSAIAPSSDHPEILRGQIVFAAQSLIEYQARQATAAGVREIFIMVETVTPQLSLMVDRLISDGIEVHLVRDMATLMRLLPRESDVLLFADGMIVDQQHIMKLTEVTHNALLVVEDSPQSGNFERLDQHFRWAGVARISPQIIFATLDLIGDWDFTLTLFRATAQADPHHIVISRDDISSGRVAMVDRQDVADLVANAFSAGTPAQEYKAGAEYYVLAPVARLIAPQILRLQIPARHVLLSSIAVILLGLMALVPGWTIVPLMLLLFGLLMAELSDHIAAMGCMVAKGEKKKRLICDILTLAGVAWIGKIFSMEAEGAYLALGTVIISFALYQQKSFPLPQWMCITPASLLILLLAGSILGIIPVMLIGGTLWALASLAVMILMREDLI